MSPSLIEGNFSFGQTAVFLLGGETITTEPDAMYLESGDIILMTGTSRLQYHGVPKIIRSNNESWNNFSDTDKEGDSVDRKLIENHDLVTFCKVKNHAYWAPFARYISQARINLNVRQVNFHEASV